MTLSNVQSSWSLGRMISRAAQATAGFLLLASAARHVGNADIAIGFENWSSENWSQLQAGILATIAAMWFLLPSLFQGSLVLCRSGRARLLIALIFTALLAYLMNFGLWLLAAQASPLQDHVSAPGLIYAFSGFAVLYLYAFVLPGRAFDYAEVPEPVPTLIRTGPVPIQRSFNLGWIFRPVAVLTLLAWWAAGWAGLYRANWLPEPALVDRVAANWSMIAAGVAFVTLVLFLGSGLGRGSDRQRGAGRRTLLGLAVVAVSVALLSPALTSGLPWASSFVLSNGSGTVDVAVVNRNGDTRGNACSRPATVTVAERRDRAFHICEVPEDIWRGLKSGDRLRLSGIQTDFGLRYTAIIRP